MGAKMLKKITLVVFFSLLAAGCGSIRPGSINARDDLRLRREAATVANQIQNDSLDFAIKRQSFLGGESALRGTDTGLTRPGLIINRYNNRKVKFEIVRDGRIVAAYTLGGSGQGPFEQNARLPIGRYAVNFYDFTVKGQYLTRTESLEVTNQANQFGPDGTAHHFIIQN